MDERKEIQVFFIGYERAYCHIEPSSRELRSYKQDIQSAHTDSPDDAYFGVFWLQNGEIQAGAINLSEWGAFARAWIEKKGSAHYVLRSRLDCLHRINY